MQRLPVWTAALALAGVSPALSANEVVDVPFEIGERLEYSLSWGVFNVGRGVLEVHPMTEINGEPVWHFSLTVRTNRFADAIYRVRSRFDSYVAADFSGTVRYEKIQREGRSERDIVVHFDRENQTATYTDRDFTDDPIEIEYPIFDPLGIVYYFRTLEPSPDRTFELRATDGKRVMLMPIRAQRTQRVRVPLGRFHTLLFEPDTGDMEGVFEQADDNSVRLWFESEAPHAPVQVAGKVAVGHFWAKLSEQEVDPETDN